MGKRMLNQKEIDLITKMSQILAVEGNEVQLGGNLYVDGKIKDLSKIVDSKGNPRFIEGNITPIVAEGITSTYAKWSLSGTHLQIVLALTIAKDTIIADSTILGEMELPSYIFEKIVPLWATNFVQYKTISAFADDWSTQQVPTTVKKDTSKISIRTSGGDTITFTKNRNIRIQFDLVIDTAE